MIFLGQERRILPIMGRSNVLGKYPSVILFFVFYLCRVTRSLAGPIPEGNDLK